MRHIMTIHRDEICTTTLVLVAKQVLLQRRRKVKKYKKAGVCCGSCKAVIQANGRLSFEDDLRF